MEDVDSASKSDALTSTASFVLSSNDDSADSFFFLPFCGRFCFLAAA